MEYKSILLQKSGNAGYITLNRPPINAIDFPGQGGIADELMRALDELDDDDDVKVVVLRGAGKCFSGGHDLKGVGTVYGMGTGQPGERRVSERARLKVDRRWFEIHKRLLYYPKITLAQVHGCAFAEGLTLVMCCDVVIAAENAELGDCNARMGFAGDAMPHLMAMLMYTVGMARAREIVLTGRILTAREAAQIGMIVKAVPPDKLEEEVTKYVNVLSLLPRDAIRIGKAFTGLIYDEMGLNSTIDFGYIAHTLHTNLRFEPDEYNYLRERRERGAKSAIAGLVDRHAQYLGR